jgi:hypothetical protein
VRQRSAHRDYTSRARQGKPQPFSRTRARDPKMPMFFLPRVVIIIVIVFALLFVFRLLRGTRR